MNLRYEGLCETHSIGKPYVNALTEEFNLGIEATILYKETSHVV